MTTIQGIGAFQTAGGYAPTAKARQEPGASPVSLSVTGRTPATTTTMASLSPPATYGMQKSFVEFKGTRAIVDANAAAYARVPDIDVTVGGPDAINALDQSPLVQPPKITPQPPKERLAQAQSQDAAQAPADGPSPAKKPPAPEQARVAEAKDVGARQTAQAEQLRKALDLDTAAGAKKTAETRKGNVLNLTV